ncbi:hypothetical protein T492DRAFT_981999, partial [Pavlovales sp. CCMP2436]
EDERMMGVAAIALGALSRFLPPAEAEALCTELAATASDSRVDGGLRAAHAAALGALCRAAPLPALVAQRAKLVSAIEKCAKDEDEVGSRQAAARAAARLLYRLTPPTAAATREQPPPPSWPAQPSVDEAAALSATAGGELDGVRNKLRACLAKLVADGDDAARTAALHALKSLARRWAAEPLARGLLAASAGEVLADQVARPSLATKELVDRALLRLLLGTSAASSNSGGEVVGPQLRALGVVLVPALADVCTRRLARLDPEESAAEDELETFY